ncbi:MAG: DUF3375 domain-containing protein [Steroidobacteraceae bacterium]|nr:DUF3375 domain-containing protein [Steroidobacteraceae bacterium]
MDHDTLDRLRQSHPAWRLLCAEHAPLVLSFLVLSFVQPNRRSAPAPELTAHLDAYLDQLRESYPDRYPRRARDYLEDWCAPGRAFLRKYYPRSGDDAEFDLTPATEQAIQWLQSLAPQQFVGTESRLLTLFQILRDLAVGSQDDPAARVKELERRREEIDREIERVRSGRAAPLDATQVKERYLQIADLARRLVADFRQVEENFRTLDLQTRERITTSTQPKGELLDAIFGETDHIHRSDQGKSFEAFWEFLMSPQRQDELREWLRAVHALQPIQELPREDIVRSIPSLLLDAGEKVQGTVAQLVEQLRRFVDDQAHLENRRIVDLIREIEQHAVRLKGAVPSAADFAGIDGLAPEISLATCRTLFQPPRNPVLGIASVETGEAQLDLSALFLQTTVDERRLRSHIHDLFRTRSQVTLAEVMEAYPPEQGLAEVVAYFRIAANDGAAVDESVRETIVIPEAAPSAGPGAGTPHNPVRPGKRVRVPRVIFAR